MTSKLKVRSVKFIPNIPGLQRYMNGPEFQSALQRRAKRVLDMYAPRMKAAAYSKWTFVRSGDGPNVEFGTKFSFAHLDEWGSVNNPVYGSMRKAISRAGLGSRFTPKGK